MRTEMIDTFDKYRQFASAIGGYYEELVQELIARTIAVEADALEQARLNGMGSEREAALMAKLEAAEKERDTLHTEFADLRSSMTFRTSLIGRIEAERDALRAKVEAMENQEPVAIAKWTAGGVAVHLVGDVRPGDILYLAPGAQPAPKKGAALAYTDPEASADENSLHIVSSLMAGRAYNSICKMIGGRWPDAKIQEEAPEAHDFFMAMFTGSPEESAVQTAARIMNIELIRERDTLRSRIEAMEKQEPVARFNWSKGELEWLRAWNYRTMDMKPLYLALGALEESK